MQRFITKNSQQTKELGGILAQEILKTRREKNAQVICLNGGLGAGKTTFTQGLLEGLGIEGPYTSPTFMIMKHYRGTQNVERKTPKERSTLRDIYHFDAYRVGSDDILDLGWEEIISDKRNVVIVEWADRIRDIIPEDAIQMEFKWLNENEREISIDHKTKDIKT